MHQKRPDQAAQFFDAPEIMLLDAPTNAPDIAATKAVEAALPEYDGT